MTPDLILVCEFDDHPRDHTDRQILEHIIDKENRIMADLTNLSAALDQLSADVAKEAADVETALVDLQAAIANLSAGTITQAQIDDLAAKAAAADTAVQAIDAAAVAATPPPTP